VSQEIQPPQSREVEYLLERHPSSGLQGGNDHPVPEQRRRDRTRLNVSGSLLTCAIFPSPSMSMALVYFDRVPVSTVVHRWNIRKTPARDEIVRSERAN
jgi:hypothetical protein